MKAILFFSVLFFSSHAYSALFQELTAGADNPFGGSYNTCGNDYCVAGYKNPYAYKEALDPGDTVNNDDFFSVGVDLVDRRMSIGVNYWVENPVTVLMEWKTFNIFDGSLHIGGLNGNHAGGNSQLSLPNAGTGSFMLSLLSGTYHFAIGGKAFDLDSFVEYRFSVMQPPSEVPLPASLFLLVPALLGFMGLRRKAKLS